MIAKGKCSIILKTSTIGRASSMFISPSSHMNPTRSAIILTKYECASSEIVVKSRVIASMKMKFFIASALLRRHCYTAPLFKRVIKARNAP
jgi:hypothetical protein